MSGVLVSILLATLVTAAPPRRGTFQVPDTTYAPVVAKPAFAGRRVVVRIDEAHNNYFTMKGYYRGFTALLEADGLRVEPGTEWFTPSALADCDVLVVADACGATKPNVPEAERSPFRPGECDAVRDWVRAGGALLLVADASPYAAAMDSLARRFGVDMARGYAVDLRRVDPEMNNPGCIVYRRDLGLLGDHAILRGRDRSERVGHVVTFSGQSLAGPPGSDGLLRMSPSSWDVPVTPGARRVADPRALPLADTTIKPRTAGSVPAVGRFQGIAFPFGRGRVVALGEGAMLTAQLLLGDEALRRGKTSLLVGVNRPDLDNQRFALNVMRWLGRVLN